MTMVEKNLRLAILNQARESLKQGNLTGREKDELLKLLEILILSLEKYVSSENLAGESRILADKLVSSQALLTLAAQQADELDALKILSLNLTASLDLPTVLDAVVKEAMRLVDNARIVHIFLYTSNKLEFGASLDSAGQKNRAFSQPRKDGLTETVAQRGKIIVVEDMKIHPLYKGAPPDWSGSIIGIPLMISEKVVGVMNLSREKTGTFSTAELRLLNMLANQAAVAISNASLHQSISRKAYTDTITGLANRRALDEHLESEIINARRTNSPFAVVMMDLDGFKSVNDSYGHEVGDQVLRAVFNVVSFGIRSSDFIARYGGDELTLILAKSDIQAAKLVTEKILENIAKFSYKAPNGRAIKLGISGGIAIYPSHGRSGPELLRAADAALYDAKKHHRGTFRIAKAATGPLDPLTLSRKNSGGN
ncbi:MAG: GGDEF domain-containing protein [Anaerolineales bacterium]|nr:GGDEF domain-containing protein [Anaerolineales bacterium]